MSAEYTYTDANELSSGAFSSVFCAVQRDSAGNAIRVVALKRVSKIPKNERKILDNDPHREKMFLESLCHENVVELLDFFESMPYGHSRKGSRFLDNSDSDELQCSASLGTEESSEESFEEENRRELRRALSQVALVTSTQATVEYPGPNSMGSQSKQQSIESSKGSRYEHDLTEEDLSIEPISTGTVSTRSTSLHSLHICKPQIIDHSDDSDSDDSGQSDRSGHPSKSSQSLYSHATSRSGMRSMKVYYIVMPYLPYNLHDLLYSNNVRFHLPQRLPIAVAKNICLQMARAVEYVHSRNVIHRDLKMLNFLLATDGTVKLGDFGQSCHISEPKLSNTGTRNYRAIELCLGRTDYDYCVDVYSLGLLFFELICARPLFSCSNDIEYVYQTNLILGPLSFAESVSSAPDFEKLVLTSEHPFQSGLKSLLSRYYPVIPTNFYSENFLVGKQPKVSQSGCMGDSSLCCDLLCKMLHPDTKQRIKAADILSHPWFRDGVGTNELVAKFVAISDGTSVDRESSMCYL